MMSYYPEYFGIIQPGHENETFWRKHLSWLDQAILLGLLIFISISLNTLWSLKHKKKKLFQLKSSTQCPWTTDHEVYSGACQHCWALTWAREYITCLTLLTLYSTRLACNMHCMCFFWLNFLFQKISNHTERTSDQRDTEWCMQFMNLMRQLSLTSICHVLWRWVTK